MDKIFTLSEVGIELGRAGVSPKTAGINFSIFIKGPVRKKFYYSIYTVNGLFTTNTPKQYICIFNPAGCLIIHSIEKTNTLFVKQPGNGFLPFKHKHNQVFVASHEGGYYNFNSTDIVFFKKSPKFGYILIE